MKQAFANHWPEYLIEGALLGLFMVSACLVGVLLDHPASPLSHSVTNPILKRVIGGVCMGLTAIALILSPIGKRSGAHMNPSVTLAFWRLGKMSKPDVIGYVGGQFVGGITGVVLSAILLRGAVAHPSVKYAATVPGPWGTGAAFLAEIVISFGMMTMVLNASNSKSLARYTPLFAGMLVALYIMIESPYSGMSMNPARTLGSAFPARVWNSLWIYFVAPPLGMLLAAEVYRRTRGLHRVFCAKFHHHNAERCIFRCNIEQLGS